MAEPSGAAINIPQWDGQAQRCAVLWELQKGAHKAVCALYTHPIGAEIRAFVDDELWRTQAGRDRKTLVDLGLTWREQFQSKGWQ